MDCPLAKIINFLYIAQEVTDFIAFDKVLTNDGRNKYCNIECVGLNKTTSAFGMLDYLYIRTCGHRADLINYASREYYYSFPK